MPIFPSANPSTRPAGLAQDLRLAITLGDPAGIGPEVTLKALYRLRKKIKPPLLLGPAEFYNRLARRLGLKLRFYNVIARSLPAGRQAQTTKLATKRRRVRPQNAWWTSPPVFYGGQSVRLLRCFPPEADPPSAGTTSVKKLADHVRNDEFPCYFPEEYPKSIRYGRPDDRWTRLAVRSIELGVRLAMKGQADAIVTPPINKAGLKKAGFDMPGHTEYLAERSGAKRFEMMLVGGGLRVVLVTRHLPLKEVPGRVSRQRVLETLQMTDLELRRSFGIRRPRIVVCGLNPHAGEQGVLGREELGVIGPAVEAHRKKTNALIAGPLSPDALFHDAYRGKYDAVVCMYHDQGLIPLKMVSRGSGVNVTLGLPFVRTSPDHGTAYDIAGRFIADPGSMEEATRMAFKLSENRRKYDNSSRSSL